MAKVKYSINLWANTPGKSSYFIKHSIIFMSATLGWKDGWDEDGNLRRLFQSIDSHKSLFIQKPWDNQGNEFYRDKLKTKEVIEALEILYKRPGGSVTRSVQLNRVKVMPPMPELEGIPGNLNTPAIPGLQGVHFVFESSDISYSF